MEGHIRFHLGVDLDSHRMAVDAFKHRDGGFTLISVDSTLNHMFAFDLARLQEQHSDFIKGTMYFPTHNQVHNEGCRIFAVHTLNAMHDYQPYFLNLHREIYAASRGRPASQLASPRWESWDGTHVLENELDNFSFLPAKFFKHMQVKTPKQGETRTLLDEAEEMNHALKEQPVNKKGQTLRQRYESLNPSKRPEEFSRADRTSSVDMKRLVLFDRAIAYYEGLAQEGRPLKKPRTDGTLQGNAGVH
jgi:hypothetical protein